FRDGLQKLGWVDGRNVVIVERWAVGSEGLVAAAAELIDLAPDVVLTATASATRPMLAATAPCQLYSRMCRTRPTTGSSPAWHGQLAISRGSPITSRRSPSNGSNCSSRSHPAWHVWGLFTIRRTPPLRRTCVPSRRPRRPSACKL